MEKIISLTRKDFRVTWYSGTGAGGQHRNKHQNCCRIVHQETGISAKGTESKSRDTNRKIAFKRLVDRLVPILTAGDQEREISREVIRNYNECRDEVHDKLTGFKQPCRIVVVDGNMGDMIEARALKKTMK